MKIYITNQKKLAVCLGITEQHFCVCKKTTTPKTFSKPIAEKGHTLTGISVDIWRSTNSPDSTLDKELKEFFEAQKKQEADAMAQAVA